MQDIGPILGSKHLRIIKSLYILNPWLNPDWKLRAIETEIKRFKEGLTEQRYFDPVLIESALFIIDLLSKAKYQYQFSVQTDIGLCLTIQ